MPKLFVVRSFSYQRLCCVFCWSEH